jgi:hypothetical protein
MRVALSLLVLLTSCSWSAYNNYKTNNPMFALSNRAFGARVAISTDTDGKAIVGIGGLPPEGARFYALNDGSSDPTGTPLTNGAHCEILADKITSGEACLAATTLSPAGSLQELDEAGVFLRPHVGCFAIGYGRRSDSAGVTPGPIVYCTSGGLYTMKPAGDSGLAKAFADRSEPAIRAQRVAMATLPSDAKAVNPPLLVGSTTDERAWIYPTIRSQTAPIEITDAVDTKGDQYGSAVAMARATGGPLFVVSAPGIGKIFAWTFDATAMTPKRVACMSGEKTLGETLQAADLDGDGIDDIFASEAGTVRVWLGKDRPPPPATTTDPCPTWNPSPSVFRCEDTQGVTGCAQSGFGASIAVGDFDKNGNMDVAIGAPFAQTDGVASGAVFLYTPKEQAEKVIDVRYLASPQENAAFGAAVASGRVGTQDTLVVGARGKSMSYVVWCSKLSGTANTARCRK